MDKNLKVDFKKTVIIVMVIIMIMITMFSYYETKNDIYTKKEICKQLGFDTYRDENNFNCCKDNTCFYKEQIKLEIYREEVLKQWNLNV